MTIIDFLKKNKFILILFLIIIVGLYSYIRNFGNWALFVSLWDIPGFFWFIGGVLFYGVPLYVANHYAKTAKFDKHKSYGKGLIYTSIPSLVLIFSSLLYAGWKSDDLGFGVFLFIFSAIPHIVYLIIGICLISFNKSK